MAVVSHNIEPETWKYFGGALGIHALLGLLLIGFSWNPAQTVVPQLAIKAVMVDAKTLNQLARTTRVEPAPAPQPDPAEAQKKQAEKERQREQQLQEQRRQQELEQQRAVEKQKQLDPRRKAEAEKQKQTAEKEKQRLADIQQKQREAEAQQAREAELAAQLAAEEGRTSAVNAGLLNQYVALIQQKVMRNWIKPPTAKAGLECEVSVTQATGGTVLSVNVGRCNGDAAVRASIEAAVQRASPLPAPPDARLFERNLLFKFKPVE